MTLFCICDLNCNVCFFDILSNWHLCDSCHYFEIFFFTLTFVNILLSWHLHHLCIWHFDSLFCQLFMSLYINFCHFSMSFHMNLSFCGHQYFVNLSSLSLIFFSSKPRLKNCLFCHFDMCQLCHIFVLYLRDVNLTASIQLN